MSASSFLSNNLPKFIKCWAVTIQFEKRFFTLSAFLISIHTFYCSSCQIIMTYKFFVQLLDIYWDFIFLEIWFLTLSIHFYWLESYYWTYCFNKLHMALCLTYHTHSVVSIIFLHFLLINYSYFTNIWCSKLTLNFPHMDL